MRSQGKVDGDPRAGDHLSLGADLDIERDVLAATRSCKDEDTW